jgi:hypothetical protein
MSNLPLPRLTPDDPENLLSHEARQRIARAFLEYDRIRKQALSAIEIRHLAEPGDLSLSEYLSTGQARIDFVESRLKAVRAVLQVEMEEYEKLGLSGRRFREIMEERIDECVYSLEFSILQRDALKAEFLWPAHQESEERPGTAESTARIEVVTPSRSISNHQAAARVKAYIGRSGSIYETFAARAGISSRTLNSLIKTGAASPSTWNAVAGAMNIEASELLKQ